MKIYDIDYGLDNETNIEMFRNLRNDIEENDIKIRIGEGFKNINELRIIVEVVKIYAPIFIKYNNGVKPFYKIIKEEQAKEGFYIGAINDARKSIDKLNIEMIERFIKAIEKIGNDGTKRTKDDRLWMNKGEFKQAYKYKRKLERIRMKALARQEQLYKNIK